MINFDYCDKCDSDKVRSFPLITPMAITWVSACDACGAEVTIGIQKKNA